MRRLMAWAVAGVGAAAVAGAYVAWVRPWQLRWGADDDEVDLHDTSDGLVESANLVATRAVTIDASPGNVWPWLVQIGTGRAGWYSYDWLDNKGKPSAREIVPELQHMDVGDVVAMGRRKGEPYGPSVLALDPPYSMLWGDDEAPHRFTWLWLLRDTGDGRTRLVSRIRCRLSWRDPLFAILMELADPVMMRKSLVTIAERAGRREQTERNEQSRQRKQAGRQGRPQTEQPAAEAS